ncbi:MAG TPA: phosphoribosyltransferase family protein [Jatrophihabitans sp.]|nr:phosphoribosyltransferase family protein [Jatrophihabitans sp.]
MPPLTALDAGRAAVLRSFSWRDGHADVWSVFADGPAFEAVVAALAAPWRESGISHVLGIESRGFLLGGAVAVRLGTGFVAIRKDGGLLPGPKLVADSRPDYRGLSHRLRMQCVLRAGHRVLLVDDWAERGSQASAVARLVEQAGAELAGLSLIVDQLDDDLRASLGRVTSLVRAGELGDPDG